MIERAGDAGPGLAWADVDGDGILELIAGRGGEWAAYTRAADRSTWLRAEGVAGAAPGGWAVAQLDAAAGPSIVVCAAVLFLLSLALPRR